MLRFTLLTAALSLLTAAPAMADLPTSEPYERPPAIEPAAVDPGAALGARLAALGTLRPLGDDFDLAVRGLFTGEGAETFRRWRALADTLADAAEGLPRHRIVIVARAPGQTSAAVDEARQRARAFTRSLTARGVDAARVSTEIAARDPSGVEFQIRFERILPLPTVGI